MKFPLPASTFPALELSEEDEEALEYIAEMLVKKTMAQYHEHLAKRSGIVDDHRWKKIKQREDVHVYRERSGNQHATDSDDLGDPTKVMPLMLTFGTIQGNLDDVMYGVLNPTAEDMVLKSAYVDDGFVDWGVLASIIKPTQESPFRELSIKWTVKGHPMLVNAVLRTRDTVYIESIGFAQTPNGERIGYHLQHSVELPAIRELLDFHIVRAKISFCHLFRQLEENTVEVFVRGLIEPMGDAPASLAAATSAEVSVSVWKNVHCAEMKKLTRIMRSRQTWPSSASSTASDALSRNSSSSGSSSSSSTPSTCALCSASVGGRIASLGSSTKEKHCRICRQRVCSKCRVYKRVHLRTELAKGLSQTNMAFCTRCVLTAAHANSAKFAEYDALEHEGKPTDNYDFGLGVDSFSGGHV